MKSVVGVTDNRWANFLRQRPHVTEANFWLPSPSGRFQALKVGEPFLFKTHWPDNLIVGGGFFSGYDTFTVREAWDLFGEGNGVASLAELCRAIAGYRKTSPDLNATIGCVLLRDLFFTMEGEELPAPADFAKNIVRFKGYDLSKPEGRHVDLLFRELMGGASFHLDVTAYSPDGVSGPVFGLPRLTAQRAGQQAFKGLVLSSYDRQCAITGNHIQPTLEAAHIRPVAKQGENLVSNGLLLRSDVHTLFDLGYLGLDTGHRLQVSPRLASEWGNGKEFYDRAGSTIHLPRERRNHPDREFLEWHMDEVFKSA